MQRWVLWRPLQRLRPTKTWSTTRAKTKTTTVNDPRDLSSVATCHRSQGIPSSNSVQCHETGLLLGLCELSTDQFCIINWSKPPLALRTWPSETGTCKKQADQSLHQIQYNVMKQVSCWVSVNYQLTNFALSTDLNHRLHSELDPAKPELRHRRGVFPGDEKRWEKYPKSSKVALEAKEITKRCAGNKESRNWKMINW